MNWTLIFPETSVQVFGAYRRMLLEQVGQEVAYHLVTLDNSRPVLSKYLHLPRIRRFRSRPDGFHLEQTFLPVLAFTRFPRCIVSVWDLCNALRPELYPCHLPERIDARLMAAGARRAEAIITPSHFQRQELAGRLPFPPERIYVAHHGIDHQLYSPGSAEERAEARAELERRYGVAADEAILLSLSAWQPRKNIPAILKTLRALLERGRRVRLLMRHQDGTRRLWSEPVRRLVAELRLDGHIVLLPPLDEGGRILHLRGASALLFPSYYEGFGLPPLEAMACGCPVVASNAATLPEIVDDAGLLIEPEDVAGLADAVEQVLDDRALRESLIRRGLARARRFTWEAAAAVHLEAYRAVAAR